MTGMTSRAAWWRPALLGAALLCGDLAVAAGNYAVRNPTAAGGGDIAEAGPYRVISTIGEPAMGTVSSGAFRLTSGFPATIGTLQGQPVGGRIFHDGFED